MKTKREKRSSHDDLATEIAKAFHEEDRVELYRYVFRKHSEAVIKRAFEEVKKVPVEKIKKSQSALFFFLLNKYEEE